MWRVVTAATVITTLVVNIIALWLWGNNAIGRAETSASLRTATDFISSLPDGAKKDEATELAAKGDLEAARNVFELAISEALTVSKRPGSSPTPMVFADAEFELADQVVKLIGPDKTPISMEGGEDDTVSITLAGKRFSLNVGEFVAIEKSPRSCVIYLTDIEDGDEGNRYTASDRAKFLLRCES